MDNIKMNPQEMGWGSTYTGSRFSQVVGTC